MCHRLSHLVEKVLYKRSYSNVIEVTVDQKKLSQELKPGDCIVTVSHSLTTLTSHNTWKQFMVQQFRAQIAGDHWSLCAATSIHLSPRGLPVSYWHHWLHPQQLRWWVSLEMFLKDAPPGHNKSKLALPRHAHTAIPIPSFTSKQAGFAGYFKVIGLLP